MVCERTGAMGQDLELRLRQQNLLQLRVKISAFGHTHRKPDRALLAMHQPDMAVECHHR